MHARRACVTVLQAALQRFDPNLDPAEAALPLTRIPGLGLPTPVPLPNLQRLYFKVCAPIDTTQLGLNVKEDAAGWQELYDGIRATGGQWHELCPCFVGRFRSGLVWGGFSAALCYSWEAPACDS